MNFSKKLKYPNHYLLELHARNRKRTKELESLLCQILLKHFPDAYGDLEDELKDIIQKNEGQSEKVDAAIENMWRSIEHSSLIERVLSRFGYTRHNADTKPLLTEWAMTEAEVTFGLPGLIKTRGLWKRETKDREP